MNLIIAILLSFTVFSAKASQWKSGGTIDMTQFKTPIEFAKFLESFDRSIESHGENQETGEQGGCSYNVNIDSFNSIGNTAFIGLIFSHSGTPGFCDEHFIEALWHDLVSLEGIELGPLNELE